MVDQPCGLGDAGGEVEVFATDRAAECSSDVEEVAWFASASQCEVGVFDVASA